VSNTSAIPETAHGGIKDPALDPAYVRPVEAAIGTEVFLRVARLLTEFAHDDADGSCPQVGRLDLTLAPLHRQIRW
jgi:hypothetical protein